MLVEPKVVSNATKSNSQPNAASCFTIMPRLLLPTEYKRLIWYQSCSELLTDTLKMTAKHRKPRWQVRWLP